MYCVDYRWLLRVHLPATIEFVVCFIIAEKKKTKYVWSIHIVIRFSPFQNNIW